MSLDVANSKQGGNDKRYRQNVSEWIMIAKRNNNQKNYFGLLICE